MNSCKACGQPAIHACEECQQEYCCGCPLQEHWLKCKAYEVCDSDDFGLFIKTTRGLQSGEVIFKEQPLVSGAAVSSIQNNVACVACFRFVAQESLVTCPQCLWPVCSLQCERIITQHELECKVLCQHQEIFLEPTSNTYRFDLLLALRTFLLQTVNKNEWNKLLDRLLKTSSCFENLDLSVDLLEQLARFLDANTNQVHDLQVFYPTASLLEQSCLPNTAQTFTDGYQTEVRAVVAIKKDTRLSISHVNLLHGTHKRLEELRKKNRTCACDRCTDPTELGTFFSALKCMDPCGGIQLPVNPLSPQTLWVCDRCHIQLFNDHVVMFVRHLGEQSAKILTTKYTRSDLEQLLQKLLVFLHPNHFHVFAIKRALLQVLDCAEEGDDLKTRIREELNAIAQTLKLF